MVADDTIHIEVTTLSTYQFEVAFWLFPNHRQGCTMYQWTLYDHGRALQSAFWRNDASGDAAGRGRGPASMTCIRTRFRGWRFYASSTRRATAPQVCLISRSRRTAMWVRRFGPTSSEPISVPAGSFSALKVTAQVDIATIMPNWPRFVLHVIKPVIPKNTLYFEATPPYRLLKQEGTTFVGGPEVTTELIRFYIAGAQPVVASATAAAGHAPPIAAVVGGASIA